jgi:light-regulated signal transduction histidine kinase (bacteriophytochrome)
MTTAGRWSWRRAELPSWRSCSSKCRRLFSPVRASVLLISANSALRRLGRLFAHLLSAAGQVWGDPVPELKLSATGGSEGCVISIRNDRPGFSRPQAARLFSVFGAGRGPMGPLDADMALCRRIVERHGGEIWAETTDSGALVVWFTLPGEATG